MGRKGLRLAMLGVLLTGLTGCATSFGPNAKNGIIFYCPGAGNLDIGDSGIREGLKAAGFRGEVASLLWTVSFNVAIDQAVKANARLGGERLARMIEDYCEQYPGRPVHLVGFSAGTGVAVFALESLKEGYAVDNVVLLGSSLWNKYDVGKAMGHVRGKMFVFYSPKDMVLAGPMKVFGTIDGVFADDAAGSVGLRSPSGRERIVNIGWRPEFERYGYVGGHFDVTSSRFLEAEVAPILVTRPSYTSGRLHRSPAIYGGSGLPVGSPR